MHERAVAAPIPIDNGQVRQVIVQYMGPRCGGVSYRGPSGRSYRFDATPNGMHRYVLGEDAERFGLHSHFEVLEDTWIDPEQDAQANRDAEVRELRAMIGAASSLPQPVLEASSVDVQSAPEAAPPSTKRRIGRPPIPDREKRLYWHLMHHCPRLWTRQELADRFGPEESKNPVGAMKARVRRIPDEIRGAEHCEFCDSNYCPDPPSLDSPERW